MKNRLTLIFIFIIVICGIIFIPFILALLFMAGGYTVSYLFKLPLFNASLLCMGSTLVVAFILFIAVYGGYNSKTIHYAIEKNDCDCQVCTFKREGLKKKKNRNKR